MIAAIALLAQAVATTLPHDWSALPLFPMPRAAEVGGGVPFVRGEIAAGRCRIGPDATTLAAPVAVLIGAEGRVLRIVPRAIGCPTVEQFTVGMVTALTRGGPGSVLPPPPGWYRLSVDYAW